MNEPVRLGSQTDASDMRRHAQSIANDSKIPETRQKSSESPKMTGKCHTYLLEMQGRTSVTWKPLGYVGHVQACTERSNRRENDEKQAGDVRVTQRQTGTAYLTYWRKEMVHRHGGWLEECCGCVEHTQGRSQRHK